MGKFVGPPFTLKKKGRKRNNIWFSASESIDCRCRPRSVCFDHLISVTSRAMPESVFEGTSLCKFFVARSDFDGELVVGLRAEAHCTLAL